MNLKLPPDMDAALDQPLFRREVMAARQTQWMGTVLLAPRFSATILTVAALLAAVAIIALLYVCSYTRKARVDGWLVPELGLVRIHVPTPGIVTEIFAREGMAVKKGDPLLSHSGDVRSQARGSSSEEVLTNLKARRDSTLEAKTRQDKLFRVKAAGLRQRLFSLELQRSDVSSQVQLQRGRLRIGGDALKASRATRTRDPAAAAQFQAFELEQIDQAGRLESLEREETTLRSNQIELRNELAELPILRKNAAAEFDRTVAQLDQEIAEAETRKSTVVVAPQDGTITAILTEAGGNATPASPLMSLVPAGSKLQAHLFGHSRAVGFVLPGQRVSLRYQPFPYQRFGAYAGTVASVSRSPVNPAELPARLAGEAVDAAATEPVYRITVELDGQTALAYGAAVPLQAGMRIEADVAVDSRRLYEWILDPLYTLTGKMAP